MPGVCTGGLGVAALLAFPGPSVLPALLLELTHPRLAHLHLGGLRAF